MEDKKIIIVGDTPGTYVCAIYLFTANIPLTVVRAAQGLEYDCTSVAGLPGATKESFLADCCAQVRHMGIEVLDGEGVEIKKNGGAFTVTNGGRPMDADILIVDRNVGGFSKQENFFVIEDEMHGYKEAIVVAGAGCKTAFRAKELLG